MLPGAQARIAPRAPERPDLLGQILAQLDDDAPRLVYADHLASHGDPLGEFIAVQCERSRLSRWDARQTALAEREEQLLLAMHAVWFPPQDDASVRFVRGFVDRIRYERPQPASRRALDKAFDAAPLLRTLDITGGAPPGDYGSAAALQRLSGLSVRGALRWWSFESLMAAPAFANLRALELRSCGLDRTSLKSLEHRPWRSLELAQNTLGANGMRLVLERVEPNALEELRVAGTGIGLAGAQHLAGLALPKLQRLDVRRCNLAGPAIEALAGAQLPALEELDLARNDVNGASFAHLCRGSFARLTQLGLHTCKLDDAALATLAESPLAAQLVALDLGGNVLTSRGVATIAATSWPALRYLNLSGNQIERASARRALRDRLPDARVVLRDTNETKGQPVPTTVRGSES